MNSSNFEIGVLYQTISENVWLLFETSERAAQATLTNFSNSNIADIMIDRAADINFRELRITTNLSIKGLYQNTPFVVLKRINNKILQVLTTEGELRYMVVNHPQYSHIHITKLSTNDTL